MRRLMLGALVALTSLAAQSGFERDAALEAYLDALAADPAMAVYQEATARESYKCPRFLWFAGTGGLRQRLCGEETPARRLEGCHDVVSCL